MKGRKGQAAAVDVVLIFLAIVIFAASIWSFTVSSKAADTQIQRSRQDFTKSMLLTILRSTPDNTDARFKGKTISDLFAMHLANEDAAPFDMVKKKLIASKINQYLGYKQGVKGTQWLLYADTGNVVTNLGGSTLWGSEDPLCFYGTGNGDEIKECPEEKIGVYQSSSASAKLIYPKKGILNNFDETDIYLFLIWESGELSESEDNPWDEGW